MVLEKGLSYQNGPGPFNYGPGTVLLKSQVHFLWLSPSEVYHKSIKPIHLAYGLSEPFNSLGTLARAVVDHGVELAKCPSHPPG